MLTMKSFHIALAAALPVVLALVGGTGDFAGAKGVLLYKDDVVNLKFDYRGNISLE